MLYDSVKQPEPPTFPLQKSVTSISNSALVKKARSVSIPTAPENFRPEYSLAQSEILAPTPQASPTPTPSPISTEAKQAEEFVVLPVGLNVGKRNVNPSVLVRGKEDGEKAISFESWLLPYDDVIKALKFSSNVLPDGQVELRSPGLVTRIDPKKLRIDKENLISADFLVD